MVKDPFKEWETVDTSYALLVDLGSSSDKPYLEILNHCCLTFLQKTTYQMT